MNKRKIKLLKYLLDNCDNGYNVIEISSIFKSVKSYKNLYDLLLEDINYLKLKNYIDLKYVDNENICLAIMDSSKLLKEDFKVDNREKKELFIFMILTMFGSGIMAFIGALIAGFIVG